MPLVHYEPLLQSGQLLLWKLDESTEELRTLYALPYNQEELRGISHPQKVREWLAGRLVIRQLAERAGINYQGLRKDEHGKPFLVGSSCPISVTHSLDYVAAVLHPDRPVGIDMEKKHEKLIRTSSKYLSEAELLQAGGDVAKLCMYWCAKEALFKLNGRQKVSFRDHIRIAPFEEDSLRLDGTLTDDGVVRSAALYVQWVGSYCLVIAT
ncbi:hypothetical protein GCM10027275_36310 [Rhabdobacter roseus]|uniref:Phosphopantetheinyl transferase n=1 Tax=Rhabdobacter roseus TaxID=1655419 RepID=A0A840TWJ7_9BACT|nr:4'-phosphopantetheinyl transferase superfamily protein [Rhabdobacter roseus]MBB5285962.1 phosphopantetheinyl transferase [Rhabdobacter roseus]